MLLINIEAILAICIFALVPSAIKYTIANPYTIGIFRLILASLIVGLFWRKKIDVRHIFSLHGLKIILLGIIFFCHWITYFFAIKIGGASACVLGMSTYGVQLIIYGAFFLNYKLKWINYVALLLVVGGVILLLPEISLQNNFSLGLFWGLLSASFYSVLPILHQKMIKDFNHETRIFSQFFFAMILFLFLLPKTDWNLNLKDWGALLYLAIFGTLIAHSLWAKVTSRLPTYISGIIYYAITPMSLTVSHFAFGEVLNKKQIMGAIIIITAAIFNVWSSRGLSRENKYDTSKNIIAK